MISNSVEPEEIKELSQLFDLHRQFMPNERNVAEEDWIFRGQKIDEGLKTSLEQTINDYGLSMEDAPKIEGGLMRRFKRQSTSYLKTIPAEGNYMEWFALMQHYGAPTRLHDWTYSFFVAVYFAVNRLKDCEVRI